jgi:ribose/xylose/arabinose/galactoside ABC-type transport system permease subunit
VILAVFVGMALSRKGIVNVQGAFFGAAFVGFLANGLGLLGISSYWIKLLEGALVVIMILGNSINQGKLVQLE